MADAETIHKARKNGRSSRQWVPVEGWSINVERVMKLVVSASETGHPGVRRAANALIEAMSVDSWRVMASAHRGGFGSATRGPDLNRHITLRVRNRTYHLQLTPVGFIRAITTDDGRDIVPPYLPPGAPHRWDPNEG